ncbi:sulfotransferase family protein [Halanaerobacter jeridensis]|uniref:Sulfotransferase family protein n=1 Tax=Halanaerobacter jeridensis TaxID=706427 RepID=A0A939BPJ4_9FIRM|nr:sulfotransferase [Halanaerobacter jeridensis]MBM7556928.1 hypothetical protein [Halanaerobacter jeridensis]
MEHNSNCYPKILYKIYDSLKLIKNFIFDRYPINDSKNELSCNPFFVIGSGRSGNTLLRSVLCNHSKVGIPPESYILGLMSRKWQTLNFLEWEDLVKVIVGTLESHPQFFTWETNLFPVYQRLLKLDKDNRSLAKIIDEIYCYYCDQKFPEAELWGDKTPINTLNLGWIDRIFDDVKYIHIIRDGRDAVNSYLKMGRYENVEEASWRWNKSIQLARNFGRTKSSNEYLEIKYEEFVSSPENEIEKVCNFLNLNFEEGMTKHHEKFDELGDVTKLEHHSNLERPINTDSIGKWEKNLSEKQRKKVNELLKKNLKILGYK